MLAVGSVFTLVGRCSGSERLARVRGRSTAARGAASAARKPAVAASAAARRWRRATASGVAGGAVALALGGRFGLALGVVAAVLLDRALGRLPARAVLERAAAVRADLPLALDLLSACLRAGTAVPRGLELVSTAMPGPLGSDLGVVAAALRLGSPPEQAWQSAAGCRELVSVARALVRATESGAALAPVVAGLAAQQRAVDLLAGEVAARRAGILVVIPLGLCFLPAFLLLGVVPVVLGLATSVLG